jgi:hypothetical protein
MSAGPPRGRAASRLAVLGREVFGFRFQYPIVEVTAGSARDLAYHLASERLFFDSMAVSEDGVPVSSVGGSEGAHNPAYVCWYGLMRLHGWLSESDEHGRESFERQVRWLRERGRAWAGGALAWPYDFDWREGACVLRAPWISGMAQGLAISVLVRAHRMSGDTRLLEMARDAARVFEIAVEDGGVRTQERGHPLYEEYPGRPLPRILDGFGFALLGLYDLWVEGHEAAVRELFLQGVQGLEANLGFWDYRGRWSRYGIHRHLCPPHYHVLNTVMLRILGRLAERPRLQEVAAGWGRRDRPTSERLEIYVQFLLTKNRTRLRQRLGVGGWSAAADPG